MRMSPTSPSSTRGQGVLARFHLSSWRTTRPGNENPRPPHGRYGGGAVLSTVAKLATATHGLSIPRWDANNSIAMTLAMVAHRPDPLLGSHGRYMPFISRDVLGSLYTYFEGLRQCGGPADAATIGVLEFWTITDVTQQIWSMRFMRRMLLDMCMLAVCEKRGICLRQSSC